MAEPRASLPISIFNYSQSPVRAASVALDCRVLWSGLGVSQGTPLRFFKAADREPLPVRVDSERGQKWVHLHVALPPASRLDVVAAPAGGWETSDVLAARWDASVDQGLISNGLLNLSLGRKGWDLALATPEKGVGGGKGRTLVREGRVDFWIDNQNRGRIQYGNPADMGLAHYANATLVNAQAVITPEGRPALRFERRMTGIAAGMTVNETLELPTGLPVLVYRIAWKNGGGSPLWVAYVGSGSGVFGKWSKDLMPGPLIERKKSAVLGDLDGSETRPAWLPQLCRISMESPASGCGIGMSTLLPMNKKVGQGSMIWGCGAGGFQCNFIDPVQGQFPFLVKPGETLENGFAFLATQAGTSVYRQTVELWQALQQGRMPILAPPCAVFIGDQSAHAQSVSTSAELLELLQSQGEIHRAALQLDFNKSFELRLQIDASAQRPVEVSALPLAKGKKQLPLLKADKPGTHIVDLNAYFRKAEEAQFVLEIKGAAREALKGVTIAQTLPQSPEVLSPVDGVSITDLATMFRWKAIPGVVDYELQIAPDSAFASPQTVRITSSQESPWYMPADEKLPKPGRYFWRLRGLLGNVLGAWSPTRQFGVNADHSRKPLKRPLTPASPLFTLEATRVLDYSRFAPDIPADVAPFVGIIAEGFEGKGITVTDFARGMEKLPHPIMLRSHWVSLADIEWLCQIVPNFIGIQGGEHLSDLYVEGKERAMTYAHRLTRICAKYGMLYQEADGTYKDDKWQDLMDRQGEFIREYGPWLVLSQKNNIIRRQFYSQSAAMGLWLGGIIGQHGAWEDGGFYWQNAGFKELGVCAGERTGLLPTMPRIWWNLVCVMGISRGCGIYSLDGQTLMVGAKEIERGTALKSGIWDNTGKTTDTFKELVLPLIRATVQHQLVPTKQQVLGNVKMAVFNDMKGLGDGKTWPHYAEYGPLYAGTYGFRAMGNISGQLWEFFPNTGRYYFIPALVQGNEPVAPRVNNVPLSALQSIDRVKEVFDAAYPVSYEGDALVCRIGDTITVQNTRENEDVTESFAMRIEGQAIATLSGKMPPHSYLLGKIENAARRLWLQMGCEYPDREIELSIACASRPALRAQPQSALKQAQWDEQARRLNLVVSPSSPTVELTIGE